MDHRLVFLLWGALISALASASPVPDAVANIRVYDLNDDNTYSRANDGDVEYKTFEFSDLGDGAQPPNPLELIRQGKLYNEPFFRDVDVDRIESIQVYDTQNDGLQGVGGGLPFPLPDRRLFAPADDEEGLDGLDLLDDAEAELKADFYSGARKKRIRYIPVLHG